MDRSISPLIAGMLIMEYFCLIIIFLLIFFVTKWGNLAWIDLYIGALLAC